MKIILALLLLISIANSAEQCLTYAIYHEARGGGEAGMVEVANVIRVRVRSKHYPNTECGVVKKRKHFSFYPAKPMSDSQAKVMSKKYPRRHTYRHWLLAKKISKRKKLNPKFPDATHYHSVKVRPYWTKKMTYLGRVGNHLFYKRGNE